MIHIHTDYLNPSKKTTVDYNGSLLAFLNESEPFNPAESGYEILINGAKLCSHSDSVDFCEKACDINVGKEDIVTIVVLPLGIDWVYVAYAVIVALVAVALTPKPDIPGLQGGQSSSPNNALKNATNQIRINQATPDIAGKRRIYPDFAAPSYHVYEQNRKVVRELFFCGVGYYNFTEPKVTETLVSELGNATVEFYEPSDNLPDYARTIAVAANAVDGQDLPFFNDPTVKFEGAYEVFNSNTIKIPNTETLIDDMGLDAGVELIINFSAAGGFNSTEEISSISDDSTDWVIEFVGTPFSALSTPFTTSDAGVEYSELILYNDGLINSTDWFYLEAGSVDDIWINIVAQQGFQNGSNSQLSRNLKIYIEEVRTGGTPLSYDFEVNVKGNSVNSLFFTFKASDYITVPAGLEWKVRVQAIGGIPSATGSRYSLKLEEIYGVSEFSNADNKNENTSMAYLERRATNLATGEQSPKFNCIAERKLQLFNGVDVDVSYTATRSFADYVFYCLYHQGGLPLEAIDTDSLFAIKTNLSGGSLGYFDYSFDDANISMEERVKAACDVARVTAFKVGGRIWSFVRDEEKPVRAALLNRRNMPPTDSVQTINFKRPREYDSVEVKWVDSAENESKSVKRKVDENGVITNELGVYPNVIDLTGCTDETQAINRADFEIRKIKYQRKNVQTRALNDGLYLSLGDRVGWADINSEVTFDGEILGESGGNYDTSERFTPNGVDTYYCYLTDDEGVPTATPFVVTARSDTEFGFVATTGLAHLPTGSEQIGSRYIIGTQGALDATDYLVVGRGGLNDDGTVDIDLVNYDVRIYEND